MAILSLSETQKIKISKLLSDAIKNKENPHPEDMGKASLILYDLIRLGYGISEGEVSEVLENSNEGYSDIIINTGDLILYL